MMSRKFFVVALALFALTSINALKRPAHNHARWAKHSASVRDLAVNKSLQSQIEVTYFTTDDPNAFISEKAGIKRSASYLSMSATQFVAKLETLERNGLASIRKQQSHDLVLGRDGRD